MKNWSVSVWETKTDGWRLTWQRGPTDGDEEKALVLLRQGIDLIEKERASEKKNALEKEEAK